jgi:protein-tyrosine phosphatase
VQQRGFRVLLAHPERSPALQRDLGLVADLVGSGVRTQLTAEAVIGHFGSATEKAARRLFDRGLVHTVASDAHHATERPPGLVNELKRAGHKGMIQWLCHDMPAWILDGGEEPPRPEAETTGRRWSLFQR